MPCPYGGAMWKNFSDGVRGLLGKRRVEQELDEELRDFLEKSAAEKMRAGMTREEAQRAARMEMGGVEVVKEDVRSVSWETHIETLWSDLRFGARLLRFNPVFAGAAILSLALGIGANTAIFQLLDAVRLRTLPVKNPQELASVRIDQRQSMSGSSSGRYSDLTYAMWVQIRAQQQGFSSIFAFSLRNSTFHLPGKFMTCRHCGSAENFLRRSALCPWLAGCCPRPTITLAALLPVW